jgi:radical SAM protein with 4Fe4S-binding SPASM domain
MIVTLDGNLLPCCNDYFEKEVMGNVTDKSLTEIWNSPKFRQFRRDLMSGRRAEYSLCRECNWEDAFQITSME